jgi:hypothetical protein
MVKREKTSPPNALSFKYKNRLQEQPVFVVVVVESR